tara:strand:- start:2 stop:643 length:642 start_codon:yes stop_codon:yes gene_type:complete
MKVTIRFLTVLALVGLFSSPLLAQKKAKVPSLFSAQVKKAVPGIDAVVSLSAEQKEKYAGLHKAMVSSEGYANATKTIKDKAAAKDDRKSALAVIKAAKEGLAGKLKEIIGADNATLVSKVNGVVSATQKELRAEYKDKMKEARKDKEARATLQKEMQGKLAASITEKVNALLSGAQKEAIKNAPTKKKGKGGKKKKAKSEKKGKKKEEADNS